MSYRPDIEQAKEKPRNTWGLRSAMSDVVRAARSGILFYWSTFLILILIEFYIGGRLSAVLTKENYSLYIGVLNTLPLYNVLTNLGISYGIVYIVSYNRSIGYQLLGQAGRLQVAWYALLVAAHVAVYMMWGSVYTLTLLLTVVISYTYVHKLNTMSFFLAQRAYNKAAMANLLQKCLLLVAFGLVLPAADALRTAFNGHFSIAYPATELGVVVFYFVLFFRTNYKAQARPWGQYRSRLLRYGKYAMANNALNVLYYTLMAFIIRSSALALHEQIVLGLCIVFFRYTAVAIAPVFSTMSPQMTVLKSNPEQIQSLYKKYLVITCVFGAATLLGCRFLFGFFIDHFYDAAYHDLPGYFHFFCYLIPLLFLTSLNGSVLAALGKVKFTTVVEVICTCVLLAFFVYNSLRPVTDYHIFFYLVLFHLCIKFLMLNYGAYKNVHLT